MKSRWGDPVEKRPVPRKSVIEGYMRLCVQMHKECNQSEKGVWHLLFGFTDCWMPRLQCPPRSVCASCACKCDQVVMNCCVGGQIVSTEEGSGYQSKTLSALRPATYRDVGDGRRQAERQADSQNPGLLSSPPATRHYPTPSTHLGPGIRSTYPSPAVQVLPAPPSSPLAMQTHRKWRHWDRGGRSGAQREPEGRSRAIIARRGGSPAHLVKLSLGQATCAWDGEGLSL
jgi:hypothetical protein